MLHRDVTFAAVLTAMSAVSAVSAETHNVREVFRDFEAVCFSYAQNGFGVELNLLIEQAGFTFVEKASDGSDVFNADAVQLIIGEKTCAFGMAQLPFDAMLGWTKDWAATQGLMHTIESKSRHGGQYWIWAGNDFDIALEEDSFANGVPLTALILVRK